jgi:ribosomal protein L11 methyltransferase
VAWWQITVKCTANELEDTEAILLNAGALSITIGDAKDEPIYEPLPGDTPLWSHSTVTGLFDQSSSPERLFSALAKRLPQHILSTLRNQPLEDQVWERVFLEQYHPLKFGQNLWICPSWHKPPEPQACNIILDPGIAFGTGSHPTTALCLEYLDEYPPQNQSVLDYGCGSGILAIAAWKLGAKRLSCIDIDPQALEATRNNAIRNDISPRDLNISLPPQLAPEPVDYLIANILSGPLVELEATFASLTQQGSRLLLSGILCEQVETVTRAYQQHFELDAVRIKEDWCRVTGIRKQ